MAATDHAPRLAVGVYAAGSLVCHQRADRSFHRGTAQLPVCARCFGLYAGALLGVCAWAAAAGLRRAPTPRAMRFAASSRPRTPLVVAAIPTVVTLITAAAGIWDPANAVRAWSALPLGVAIGAVVTAVAAGDLR